MTRTLSHTTAAALAALVTAIAMAMTTPTLARAETPAQQTIEAFFAALEAKDFGALGTLMSDDVVTILPMTQSGETGRDAMRVFEGKQMTLGYFGQAGQAIGTVAFTDTVITLNADETRAVIENRGNMVLADGRDYRNLYIWALELDDGTITGIREYTNPITAAFAFGFALPEAPSN